MRTLESKGKIFRLFDKEKEPCISLILIGKELYLDNNFMGGHISILMGLGQEIEFKFYDKDE
jgi:hypothetical protein